MIVRPAPYRQSSYLSDSRKAVEVDPIDYLASTVIASGRNVNSRYGPCLEILGGRLEVPSGRLVARAGINYSLGWMEVLQLIAGVFDLEGLKRVAPKADHSLFTYSMAYGPRIRVEMPAILETLRNNPDSRQAVLFIAKPGDGPTSDLPCTLTIQFLIRNGYVNAIVTMRSWDLSRGLPYDLMMFSALLEVVGRCLHLETGTVTVQAGSTHIYLDLLNKTPSLSPRLWAFTQDGPWVWKDFVGWAANNIPLLEKGGTPGCIEYSY